MAKKEKTPDAEADGEKPEGEATDAAPKKGLRKFLTKKILMIAVRALLLVFGGGGAGAYFFLFKSDGAHEAKAEEVPPTPPKVASSGKEDILVNIQSNDRTPSYLKLGLSVVPDNYRHKAT